MKGTLALVYSIGGRGQLSEEKNLGKGNGEIKKKGGSSALRKQSKSPEGSSTQNWDRQIEVGG